MDAASGFIFEAAVLANGVRNGGGLALTGQSNKRYDHCNGRAEELHDDEMSAFELFVWIVLV
jgi:hypothetical protein